MKALFSKTKLLNIGSQFGDFLGQKKVNFILNQIYTLLVVEKNKKIRLIDNFNPSDKIAAGYTYKEKRLTRQNIKITSFLIHGNCFL